jgi:hypothetical protein
MKKSPPIIIPSYSEPSPIVFDPLKPDYSLEQLVHYSNENSLHLEEIPNQIFIIFVFKF